MKYFFMFFALLCFVFSIHDAHSLLVSDDPVGEMDVVAVGIIVSAVPGTNLYGVPETQYVVDVEEIVKGSDILEDGIDTKSLEFSAPGVLDSQDNLIYRKIFGVNDRVLLMLEQKDGLLHASLWSRATPSNCSGNELIQLLSAPGGLSIHQDKQNNSPFYTGHPIVVQYSFFNKNMTAITQNVTINVIDDFPEIYHSESFVLNLDECQAYETATTEFVMDKPGSISIHTVINGETSHGLSGLDVIEHVMSPLKQFKAGVLADEIRCNDDLVLLQRYDGSPACVTESTKQKLVERGWIHSCPNGMLNKQRSLCIAGSPGISGGSESESELQIISKNEILSKGTGFDLPEDTFTQEDLKNLEQKERELNKIANNPDTAEEKRRQIHLEIQEMQVRLQYPFQTGVPYHLVLFMQEKYQIFQEHRSELKGEISVTYSSPTDISHVHHALRIGIHPDSFTLSELEYQNEKIRKYLGNEMNILYEPALIIAIENEN